MSVAKRKGDGANPDLIRSSVSRAKASASISSSSLSISLIAYTLFGFPVIISHILWVSSSRHLLGGGDSDRLGERERRRLSFVSVLLFKHNDRDCWDVEGLMAKGLSTLFRLAACRDSLSGGAALGGPVNLEGVDAARVGLFEEGRDVKLAAFFRDELDITGVGVVIDPRPFQLTTWYDRRQQS